MTRYKSLYDVQRAIDDYTAYPTSQRNGISSELHTIDAIREILARPDEPEPDTRYNGWTDYPTWRINLELLSDYCDMLESDRQVFAGTWELAGHLKDHVDSLIEEYPEGFVRDYADAFVSDVNYDEIAAHYPELIESDDDDTDDEGER